MREVHVKNRVMVRLGAGIAAPLRTVEVLRLEKMAHEDGYKQVSAWLAEIIRAAVLNPSPAVLNPQPSRARSWADVTDLAERQRLGAEWIKTVPMPAGFKEMSKEEKLAWLNRNWPLVGE